MELTYMVIIAFITFVVAELLKVFSVDKKFIPLINLGIGLLSAAVCFLIGVLPMDTALAIASGLISCVIAACGAGGFYDILKTKVTENTDSELGYKAATKIYGEPVGDIPEAPVSHSRGEVEYQRMFGKEDEDSEAKG